MSESTFREEFQRYTADPRQRRDGILEEYTFNDVPAELPAVTNKRSSVAGGKRSSSAGRRLSYVQRPDKVSLGGGLCAGVAGLSGAAAAWSCFMSGA